MQKVIDCTNCHTTLHLPQGAISIRCAVCRAITHVAAPRSIPAPQFYYNNNHSTSHRLPPYAPAPYSGSVPWAPAPPSAQGSKRAVICGISYKGSEYELKGCLNDAKCMKYMLVNRFNFPESSILMLTGGSPASFCTSWIMLTFCYILAYKVNINSSYAVHPFLCYNYLIILKIDTIFCKSKN